MEFDGLSHKVIGCALEVHKILGPGLLESVYEQCLARELSIREIPFRRQVGLPLRYKGLQLECGYRIDFIVEERIIVELKCVEELSGIHQAQLLTYMKLTGIRTGLLINFNVRALRRGIKRFVL